MIEYQYWTHKNGGTYAVKIINGQVAGACGPLHYEDRLENICDGEYDEKDGRWVQNNKDDFRLEERCAP